eukprot:scaffold157158_cov21-Prasinocladus_malaysianus.AAC.1
MAQCFDRLDQFSYPYVLRYDELNRETVANNRESVESKIQMPPWNPRFPVLRGTIRKCGYCMRIKIGRKPTTSLSVDCETGTRDTRISPYCGPYRHA